MLGGIQLPFIRFVTSKASFFCFQIFKHFAFTPVRVIMLVESGSFVEGRSLFQPAYFVEIC